MTTPLIPLPTDALQWRARALFGVTTLLSKFGPPPTPERPVPNALAKWSKREVPTWLSGKLPAGVSIEDRQGPVPVRIYTADSFSDLQPTLVYFHGGGWVMGCVESSNVLCAELAVRCQIRVVSVDYRLSPQTPYPGPLDDCLASLQWLIDNAADLHVDVTKIAVGGDSAGGNLAAAVAIRARDEGLVPLVGQLLVYPAVDASLGGESMTTYQGPALRKAAMEVYWAAYAGAHDRNDPHLSPASVQSVRGLPAAIVVTAGHCCLKSEGTAYVERLRAGGVAVAHWHYPQAPHGFLSLAGLCPAAADALSDIAPALTALFERR